MLAWEESVMDGFRLASLLLAIAAVLMVEIWGLVKIWRVLRKLAATERHPPDAHLSTEIQGPQR